MSPSRGPASARPTLEVLEPGHPGVEAIWRGLERESEPRYFLSWGWISTWLTCLARAEAPRLAVLSLDGRPVGAGFLCRRRVVRHGALPVRALFLNTTGSPRWDDLTLEHNGIVGPWASGLTLSALVSALPDGWDELHLPALSADAFPGNALGEPLERHVVRVDRRAPAPFVDLEKVRKAEGGYLSLLGTSTRAQVRRAVRGFPDLRREVAAGVEEALEMYAELVALHARTWQARGQAGAFADPWIDSFHRRLIADRFPHGEIQLLRLRSRGATVGCLYNLVAYGRVLFYQSGLAPIDDPRLKAGYVCHAEAILHNAAAGHAVYDLLAGGGQYKLSLATDAAELVWARIQRPLLRFAVEERLRAFRRGR